MKTKQTGQHKRMAMGDTVKGYARGGVIGTMRDINPAPAPAPRGKLVTKGGGGKCGCK